MELKDYRRQINEIDDQMVALYKKRMALSQQIGAYKLANGLPVRDAKREQALLDRLGELAGDEYRSGIRSWYTLLLSLSRARQSEMVSAASPLSEQIRQAVENTPPVFPAQATVACQGIAGAYSQSAAQRLFSQADITFFPTFEAVFDAVERGECRYGVLPVENSTAGSVNRIYDLMAQYRFSIVRTVRLPVSHVLCGVPGATLSDIRRVCSHEQALQQCRDYLCGLDVCTIPCPNTAMAARQVQRESRKDTAAICSADCAKRYGLTVLARDISRSIANFTRFVCLSREPEIYPEADRTSLLLTLPHRPGSLFEALSRLNALGLNLHKLESRPLPDRPFEFLFYFDIEGSAAAEPLRALLCAWAQECSQFRYLGSYREVMA